MVPENKKVSNGGWLFTGTGEEGIWGGNRNVLHLDLGCDYTNVRLLKHIKLYI